MRKTLIKRKKTSRQKKRRHTRKNQRGAGLGSDLRQQLVTACRQGDWDKYDGITQQILKDYHSGKKDFFIHLKNQMPTFKKDTVLCLERSLTQLQEMAIPESMEHLSYIIDVRDGRA